MAIRTIILSIALLTPIPAEAQLTDVDCVAIVDSVGTRVARVISGSILTQYFYKEHNGFMVPFRLIDNAIRGVEGQIWFTDANCSSTPFVSMFVAPPFGLATPFDLASSRSVVIGQDVYYAEPAAVPQNIQVLSFRSTYNESCQSEITGVPFPLSLYAFPLTGQFKLPQYTPPFLVESEACVTPADPDPEQIVTGCIKKNGMIKIVDDPADCSSRETPISWLVNN